MITTGLKRQEVVITREFDAPLELVWKAWTDPALFAQWYGLSNSTLSDVRMDVRAGGGWSAVMHIEKAPDISWKADYLEVLEPNRLVFALKDPDNPESPNREIVTVMLRKVGVKTRLVFNQSGNLPPEQYENGLKQGWNKFFNRMETLLKGEKTDLTS
jgi:uncharacterized protein YndB with AHSA1/START domain